ncbi:MAG: hypothetical protein ACE5FB_02380, partial [Candidatus Binatia bacterium]
MDDLRESLKKAENQIRGEMDNLNEALKHVLLAQKLVDQETPHMPEEEGEMLAEAVDPHDVLIAKAEQRQRAVLLDDKPSELEVKHKTRYKKGTLSTCIVNVLKRMGEPVNSKKIHEELMAGGWKTDSKDSLMAVRSGLVRL